MPIYEYICENCQEKTEFLQKVSDEPKVICPNCEQSTLKKLVSAAGFRLKGQGWYETDFKQSQQKNLADKKETAPEAKKADTDSTSTSTKTGSAGATASSTTAKKEAT